MTDFATRLNDFLFDQLTIGFAAFVALCLLVVWVMNQIKLDRKAPLPFTVERGLKWYAIALSPIWLALLIGVLWAAFTILAQLVSFEVTSENSESLRSLTLGMVGIFTAIGATIGAPLALARARATEKQTHTAEQGLITDRINKAVEGLGATKQVKRQRRNSKGERLYEDAEGETLDYKRPIFEDVTEENLEVRVGAIFALERIAQDSLRDHVQIMEILCSYIRQNSPATDATNYARRDLPNFRGSNSDLQVKLDLPRLRVDIQTALTVIGRRSTAQRQIELKQGRGTIALNGCNFQKFVGSDLDFSGLNFSGSWFTEAHLSDCHFVGCEFVNATLDHGSMIRCNLQDVVANGAVFDHRILPGSSLKGANLFKAGFNCASLLENPNYGAKTDFSYANITCAKFGNAMGAEYLFEDDLIFNGLDSKHGKWHLHKDEDYFYIYISECWSSWKKSLGYTSSKYKQ